MNFLLSFYFYFTSCCEKRNAKLLFTPVGIQLDWMSIVFCVLQ
jgi:hypothetical protein